MSTLDLKCRPQSQNVDPGPLSVDPDPKMSTLGFAKNPGKQGAIKNRIYGGGFYGFGGPVGSLGSLVSRRCDPLLQGKIAFTRQKHILGLWVSK